MNEPAVRIEDLTVRFDGRGGAVTALDRLSLSVEPGRVFGFLGPNGAGKTTTIHVLLGFVEATGGRAALFGRDVRESIARQRIGYLPEHPDLYRFLTGRELLRFAGRLAGWRGHSLETRIGEVLREIDLEAAADRRIGAYSRGMRQRIALGQAIVHDPDLLILDEPTSGLDPIARQSVRNMIRRWRERGRTVFFSSHELSEVELVCDEIAIMANGRLVASGPPASLVKPGEQLEPYFMRMVGAVQGGAGKEPVR
jgi:ABC-2 type transport system ATP-binding protein